ncbi:integrase core domain protein [Mycobacterium pseudoshottsii JCM 15466]|nr:integrase core domain protein [Mycobacterium pseudoshottsii JCM 15466]
MAMDFQFDFTTDSKAVKIASMVDEHIRESLLNIVERSITAERLIAGLEWVFAAAGGPPKVLRMDNGPELISQALRQFCDRKVGLCYIQPRTPWNNATSNRSTTGYEGSASTAAAGPTHSKTAWSWTISTTNTIIGIVTPHWVTCPRGVGCPMQPHSLPRGPLPCGP